MIVFALATVSVRSASPFDYAVQATASVAESPAAITLLWPFVSQATSYTITRKLLTESNWSPMATLPGTAVSWTDLSVSAGTAYEYQIRRDQNIGVVAWGTVCAGIRIPAVDHRGTLILIVDNTMAVPLASELGQLADDLIGDGWSVVRRDVARTDTVTSVKALILTEYNAAPSEVRSVFLFGHVPVPYSGNTSEGHDDHVGAWPADVYYGELDSLWTDTLINNTTSRFPEQHNVPGDGKFDQTWIPSNQGIASGIMELEVGRVDLADLPAFLPKTETDLLRQYLNKAHAHRHAVNVLPPTAVVDDRFGEWYGVAMAQNGWRLASLLGAAQVGAGTFGQLATQESLFLYLCGPGSNESVDSIRTADFVASDPKAAFFLVFGSYFGDWDKPNNLLRAPLATTSYGLASGWAGYPLWFMHRMSLGGTIGDSARETQSNRYDASFNTIYYPANPNTNQITTALMGDPALRLLAVPPPSALTVTRDSAGHAALTWATSPGATLGYYIYRSASSVGPFTRLTANPVGITNWTDTSVVSGTFTYQVKAVKLETTTGGTYVNTSQAVSKAITLSGASAVTYDSWAADAGLTGNDALPLADPDKNGLSNLLEYALGLAHGSPDMSGLPAAAASNGELTLAYRPLRNDLTYQPEWSTDLINWSANGITLTSSGDTVTAHLLAGTAPKKFLHLKIVK